MSNPKKEPNAAWLNFLGLIIAAIIGVTGTIYVASKYKQSHEEIPPPPHVVHDSLPAAGDVLMFYGPSSEDWIRPAAEKFNQLHSGSKIVPTSMGSHDGKDIIFKQKKPPFPVLWSPGDDYWVDKLAYDWKARELKQPHPGETDIIGARENILQTHYVFVMWEDRASVFKEAMKQPEYLHKPWHLLHTLATKGWSQIGGKAEWGKLKLFHSDPATSSSGLLTLGLMLAEYRRVQDQDKPYAKANDNAYVDWMKEIENCLGSDQLPDTTKLVIQEFLHSRPDKEKYIENGPAKVDMIIVYEANALNLLKKGQQHIQMIYPEPIFCLNYPLVVLKGNWVTAPQAQVGEAFIKYLRESEIQEKTAEVGFYPALDYLRDKENKQWKGEDSRYTDAGFRLRPKTEDIPVKREDLEDVYYIWCKWKGIPTGDSPVNTPWQTEGVHRP